MKKIFLNLVVIFFMVISCTDTKTEIITHELNVGTNGVVQFQSGANSQSLALNTDIDFSNLLVGVAGNGKSWCEAVVDEQEKAIVIKVKDNEQTSVRTTVVTVFGKNLKQDIEVSQNGNIIPKDMPVAVSKVTATSFADGHEAEKMIDGDMSTFFNSKIGAITEWPFTLDFYFKDAPKIDYLVYAPRPSGANAWGSLGKVEIYASTVDNPTLVKMGEADFLQTNDIAREFVFEKPLEKPLQVQVRVFSGFNDRVSCTEMQFFNRGESLEFDYKSVFTDGSCSKLKQGITQTDVDAIPILFYKQIAQNILSGNTDPYRIAQFRPYQHPNIMAAVNKTSRYSLRDNATGIFINEPDKDFALLVGDTHGQDVKINIFDFQNKNNVTFSLKEGLNVITPTIPGLVYIYNHTDKAIPLIAKDEAAQKAIDELTVTVQFLGGEVNGYFDIAKNKAEEWPTILNNAKFTEIDVLGVYSHVVWTVEDYKKYNTDIVLMTNYIDSLANQQQEFAGLYHYNKLFRNRIFITIDYSAPAAYATDYRTAYNSNYANVMCSEEGFLRRMWVLGHEVGHINQVRPGVKWHGTTEVTNNLYAMYNQFRILGEAPRLFDNSDRDGYGFGFKHIIEAKQPFLLPDNFNNHIPKVAPLWQLYLYFVEIKGQKHFYHDVFEHFRTNAVSSDPGEQQLDFVRQVCHIGKTDLTDFFIAWGFLRPIDRVINDYGEKTVRVTQQQIDGLIAEIKAKKYPVPGYKVEEITDKNYKSYIK